MAFDPKVAEAQSAFNLIGTTDIPNLAWDALGAGLDGPAIRRLAAFEFTYIPQGPGIAATRHARNVLGADT